MTGGFVGLLNPTRTNTAFFCQVSSSTATPVPPFPCHPPRGAGDAPDQTPAPELCPPGARTCPAGASGRRGSKATAFSLLTAALLRSWCLAKKGHPASRGGPPLPIPPRARARGPVNTRPRVRGAGGLVTGTEATDQDRSRPGQRTVRARLFPGPLSKLPSLRPPASGRGVGLAMPRPLPYAGREIRTLSGEGIRHVAVRANEHPRAAGGTALPARPAAGRVDGGPAVRPAAGR